MLRGIHHTGISVSDLDRSINFYRDLLGMELLSNNRFSDNPVLNTIIDLKDAVGRVAMLRSNNAFLELFEYLQPTPRVSDIRRPVCDHGITHVCFAVEDIESDYKRLKAVGIIFHCEPQLVGKVKATYGRDPDGNVFELLEIPEEIDSDRRIPEVWR